MDSLFLQQTGPLVKPNQASFSPYESNEGSIVAISGGDFVVIASDTRLSSGYSIYTREQPKLFKLSDKTILGLASCWCDALTLAKIVEARMKMYGHEHNKEMSTPAVSQMVSSLLYYKRFFPYYVTTVVAGLDSDNVGRIYSYDSVGSKVESSNIACGSASHLLQPLLDNQVDGKNIGDIVPKKAPVFSREEAVNIIRDVFVSAAERDIYTGDSILIYILTAEGIKEMTFPLRKD